MKADPRRRQRSPYPFWIEVPLRYADMDTMGHVNNVAHVAFLQEARVCFLRRLFEVEKTDFGATRLFIARLEIDYLREARYPGLMDVGVGVLRTGRTSYTLGLASFMGDECISAADAVMVHGDSSGPAPLTEKVRARLAEFALRF